MFAMETEAVSGRLPACPAPLINRWRTAIAMAAIGFGFAYADVRGLPDGQLRADDRERHGALPQIEAKPDHTRTAPFN